MFKWFKKLREIVSKYDSDQERLRAEIKQVDQVLKDRTDLHVDVNMKDKSTVIMIGKFRDRDYIQTYTMETYDFHNLVTWLQNLKKQGHVRTVDVHPEMDVVIQQLKD